MTLEFTKTNRCSQFARPRSHRDNTDAATLPGSPVRPQRYTAHRNPISLHFARVADDARCIVVTRVCVSVCLSVCLSVRLSAAACLHYCTHPDTTWGSGRGCPLVVHYSADLQSVHGLPCYGNITRIRNVSEYMLVFVLRLVLYK